MQPAPAKSSRLSAKQAAANRVDKAKAYLLHRRPYSETSMICYFLTRDYGVVHLLARGAKRKRGAYATLQPGSEIFLSWSGRSSLKTMTGVEISRRHELYSGAKLTKLLYTNELLLKLLKPYDAHPELYSGYHEFLNKESQTPQDNNLRQFELQLFAAVGYAVAFDRDYKNNQALNQDAYYRYDPGSGWTLTQDTAAANSFHGKEIHFIKQGDYSITEANLAARRLARIIIHYLLEGKHLSSRKLINF